MLTDLRVREILDDLLDLVLLRRVDVELDPGVEILDVLAHDDEIDVAAWCGHAAIRLLRRSSRRRVDALPARRQLKRDGKDVTIVVFPGAGHGLLDGPPADPNAPTVLVERRRLTPPT